jgi:hypothetical protein
MLCSPFPQEGPIVPIVYGLFKYKKRWSPPLGACVALKIGKNGLAAKKVTPSEVRVLSGICKVRKIY